MNIEKNGAKQTFMFHDNTSPSKSDINIQRPTNLQPSKHSSHHHHQHSKKPILNESNFEKTKSVNPRPKLSVPSDNKRGYVPMDGLDLLSNPKRFDRDEFSNGKESVNDDNDDDASIDNSGASVPTTGDGDDEGTTLQDDMDGEDESSDNGHPLGSGSNNSVTSGSKSSSNSSGSDSPRKKTYDEIQQEKQKYLFILDRLIKAGYIPTRKYTMASNLEDIIYEVTRLKRERDIDKSIKFQRKLLMAFTSGTEFMNNKFDPIGAKLDDWSEHVMEGISDYDEVFEELHDDDVKNV